MQRVGANHIQEMLCGKLCHARWLTTAQRIIFLWTRKHDLTGKNLKVLEMLAKFCLQHYFKLFYDIKVKHLIQDAPYHILTSVRLLRQQPKKVQDAVTFYLRTGAWFRTASVSCCPCWPAQTQWTGALLWTRL